MRKKSRVVVVVGTGMLVACLLVGVVLLRQHGRVPAAPLTGIGPSLGRLVVLPTVPTVSGALLYDASGTSLTPASSLDRAVLVDWDEYLSAPSALISVYADDGMRFVRRGDLRVFESQTPGDAALLSGLNAQLQNDSGTDFKGVDVTTDNDQWLVIGVRLANGKRPYEVWLERSHGKLSGQAAVVR